MMAAIGDNKGPSLTSRTAWAKALFNDPDTPVYVIAMAWIIHWYVGRDGSGAALSNAQFSKMCGTSTSSVKRGKTWLAKRGYVYIEPSDGGRNKKSRFTIQLPTVKGSTQSQFKSAKGVQTEPVQTGKGVQGEPRGGQGEPARGFTVDHALTQDSIQDYTPPQTPQGDLDKKMGIGGASFWQKELNPDFNGEHTGAVMQDGKLILMNGTRAKWLKKFSGDSDRLEFAIDEASGCINENRTDKPVFVQAESHLGRIAQRVHGKGGKKSESAADYEKKLRKITGG